ncbi:hypothetical protein, partial [Aeromonas allosaccharophila]
EKRKKKLKSVAMFQRKIPTQVGIFFCPQFSTSTSSVAVVTSRTPAFIVPHRHTATPPHRHIATSHLLYSALPRLPDCTHVHRDAAHVNASHKANPSNKKGRPRPARKGA